MTKKSNRELLTGRQNTREVVQSCPLQSGQSSVRQTFAANYFVGTSAVMVKALLNDITKCNASSTLQLRLVNASVVA